MSGISKRHFSRLEHDASDIQTIEIHLYITENHLHKQYFAGIL